MLYFKHLFTITCLYQLSPIKSDIKKLVKCMLRVLGHPGLHHTKSPSQVLTELGNVGLSWLLMGAMLAPSLQLGGVGLIGSQVAGSNSQSIFCTWGSTSITCCRCLYEWVLIMFLLFLSVLQFPLHLKAAKTPFPTSRWRWRQGHDPEMLRIMHIS